MSNVANFKQKYSPHEYKKYKQRYYKNKQLKQKQQQAYYNCCYSYQYENEPYYYYYSSPYNTNQKQQQYVKPKQQQESVNYDFSKLPNIVLKNIYSYLPLKEKLIASSTCSNWRNALYHPALWQNFTLRIYLCYNEDIQSAYYKANAFGKYTNKVVIHHEPNDCFLLQELVSVLEIIKHNRNITEVSLFPMHNTDGYDEYFYTNSKNVDLANKRIMKNLTDLIQNAQNLEHLALGCNTNLLIHNFEETLNDLCKKHDTKVRSLHVSGIKSQFRHQQRALATDNNRYFLLKFKYLECLSIDRKHLSNELLKDVCSKSLKVLNVNVNDLDETETPRVNDDLWQQVAQLNPQLRVNVNIIAIEDLARKFEQILKPKMPVERLRMFFCKSLNPDILQFVRDNYCETLKTLCVVDGITDPTLRYHSPFRNDADPLVLLAWKCTRLQELTLIGYEILEINLTAIAQLRNNLKIFHIPMDCVITLRYGQFGEADDEFFEDEDGDDALVDYGICSNQVISKISKTLGYNWRLLCKYELPLCIYDNDMPYEEVIFEFLLKDQYPKQQ